MRSAYTVPALAEELGKSVSYIEGLIRNQKLATKKLGRTTLIRAVDLDVFLSGLPDA